MELSFTVEKLFENVNYLDSETGSDVICSTGLAYDKLVRSLT